MDVAAYYRTLIDHRAAIMAECVADAPTFALHTASHNALKDFERVLGIITGFERSVFTQACREYQYSIEAALFGNYRHAFSSLRLSFELFTATVYFSANQMNGRLWLEGHDDIWWGTLVDPDKGVFSDRFMKAFNPSIGQHRLKYASLASKVYRECSEYVHGNPGTHEQAGLVVCYDAKRAQAFHDKAATIRLCVLFQVASRYLLELDSASKDAIEPLMLESFGHLPEIQLIYGEK